jgi:hypothetical protein
MLLEIGRAVSLALSFISLLVLLEGAFFIPATRWEERLVISISRIGFAACVCFASGTLFHYFEPKVPVTRTLPVRLFLFASFGFAVLFVIGWYLDVYYVPQLWRNQPH